MKTEKSDKIIDYKNYSYGFLLVDAKEAHEKKIVIYNTSGEVTFTHPELKVRLGKESLLIGLDHQFSAIRPAFEDLNTALSALANSPLLEGNKSLRQLYDEELVKYEEMTATTFAQGGWEPDYGTYMFDFVKKDLYLIAPQFWHRLALVTSNSKLLTDPEGKMSWLDIRKLLENKVVGFAGVSVGGGVLEGWLREARPLKVKIADPDWVGATNFNRGERMSLRHLISSRDKRPDPRNPYYAPRVNKAEYIAYEEQLVDPYSTFFIYKEGLNETNFERFLLGNGKDEPAIDLFVEEVDDFWFKYKAREICKKHKIPLIMMSDFGHQVLGQFQDFKSEPNASLGYNISDEELLSKVKKAISGGNREFIWEYVRAICGEDFANDEFKQWVDGKGEQPTASLPQSGATAMASGGIGGKLIAMHFLGHKIPGRFVYDIKHTSVEK